MSCTSGIPTFRLLDGFVGWHAAETTGEPLDGLNDEGGLRLRDPYALEVPADVLTPHLAPPWLARGCGPCTWFVIGNGERPAVWMRDPCDATRWVDLRSRLVLGDELSRLCALAHHRNWLAVADAGNQSVFVWSIPDGRLLARIPVKEPGPLVFAPWGGLLVVSAQRTLLRFSITGEPRRERCILDKPVHRLGRGNDGAVYAATGATADGPFAIVRITLISAISADEYARPCDDPWRLEREDDTDRRWAAALPRTGLIVANERGFCIEEPGEDGLPVRRCFTRGGVTVRQEEVVPPPPQSQTRTAILETNWLDSGIPRCRWHRVRADVRLPADTAVKVFVASGEGQAESLAPPVDADWEELPSNDALIQNQPAGRCLRLRIELKGGLATPMVRRVRLDFPRATSMDRLPPVYRDNPIAEDFTERFLALFDAAQEDTDRTIDLFARLLNATSAPREALPWLASLFGVQLDPSWDDRRARAVLAALPTLYAQRGTIAGLRDAIRLLFDIEPAIVEHAVTRPWGAVGWARLRGVRLFGKAAARFRLGHSALGRSGLIRFGTPELDPFRNVAHRFSVLVPPLSLPSSDVAAQLNRLIERQKPAHTEHALRIGGEGLLVGLRSAVGIDTVFVPPTRAVLGKRRAPAQPGTARLNHRTALFPGTRRRRHGFEIGQAVIGMSTVLE